MSLTPQTADALGQALDAVIAECGDDPQYHDLIQHLGEAQQSLQGAEGDHAPAAEAPDEPDPSGSDPHGFQAAKEQFMARRKDAAN
jgi:hypothetical protein